MLKKLFVITGPTGIGKTNLSIDVAKALDTVIISSDSRQIYKELNIGTAVPEKEQLEAVKHYFIGSKSIHDYYNASMFEFEVIDLLKELFKTKNNVLMTGGSGMYIDAVCYGIDDLPTIKPEVRAKYAEKLKEEGLEILLDELKNIDIEYYNTVDKNNSKRVLKALEVFEMTGKPYSTFRTQKKKKRDFDIVKIGLNRDRTELYDRINKRVELMIEKGLIQEARRFFEYKHLNSLNTVGYKELFSYFEGESTLEEAIERIKCNSRKYARKQLTWFRRDKSINWFQPQEVEKIIDFCKSLTTFH